MIFELYIKKITIIKYLIIVLILLLYSCKKKDVLPPSITLKGNMIEFNLVDKNYKSVSFGNNIGGIWSIQEMKNVDGVWKYSFHIYVTGEFEYKFLINDSLWLEDPINNNKKMVPPPFKGYNSIFTLN